MMAFRQTARLMIEELIERLEADGHDGVHPSHHALYENIDPEGTRLTELAARAGMTHQSMGELVASLERGGWVERRPDPTDGRARLVCLTPSGRRPRHPRPAPHRRDRGRVAGALARGRPRRHAAPGARARREGRRARARRGLRRRARRPACAPRPPTARRGGRGSACRSDGARATRPSRPARAARRRRPAARAGARRRSPSQPAATRSADAVDRRALAQQAREAVDDLVDRPGPAVQEEVARRARRRERAPPAVARQQVDDPRPRLVDVDRRRGVDVDLPVVGGQQHDASPRAARAARRRARRGSAAPSAANCGEDGPCWWPMASTSSQ